MPNLALCSLYHYKRKLGIATHVSAIKVKVTVAKNETPCPLIYLSFPRPIDTKLGVWVAYIKKLLGIATQVSVMKVKITVAKIEK